MANDLQNTEGKLTTILKSGAIQERLKSMLDKNADSFTTSIMNVVNGSAALQKCTPMSIVKASMVAASLNLAVDPNLGFAAIVPYKNKEIDEAQFQMMYKGFIQLAIRSGQYETINVSEVYEDEFDSYNPFTGEVKFTNQTHWKMRYSEGGAVVGYFAFFGLLTGFKKSLYMTKEEVNKHALTYSKSYQYDKKKGYTSSRWSQDFDAMGKKTVIKMLLSKYGVLSIEMQKAVVFDQARIGGTPEDPKAEFIDNPDHKEPVVVPDTFQDAKDVDYQEVDLTGSPFEGDDQ